MTSQQGCGRSEGGKEEGTNKGTMEKWNEGSHKGRKDRSMLGRMEWREEGKDVVRNESQTEIIR